MVKKVPGINAWVLKYQDLHILRRLVKLSNWTIRRCPLFDPYIADPIIIGFLDITFNNDQYVVVVNDCLDRIAVRDDESMFTYHLNQDAIDSINKTWNEFYE